MPAVLDHVHYRNVDVSTFNEAASRWQPDLHKARPADRKLHRSIPDCEDSIATARYWRNHLFAA